MLATDSQPIHSMLYVSMSSSVIECTDLHVRHHPYPVGGVVHLYEAIPHADPQLPAQAAHRANVAREDLRDVDVHRRALRCGLYAHVGRQLAKVHDARRGRDECSADDNPKVLRGQRYAQRTAQSEDVLHAHEQPARHTAVRRGRTVNCLRPRPQHATEQLRKAHLVHHTATAVTSK
jgi:hypothetical protein